MDENALVQMICPNCGKKHINTLDHLMVHWQQAFRCVDGCGVLMRLERQELLDAINAQAAPLVITMHAID